MKINIDVFANSHKYSITCCDKDDLRIYKSRSGHCFIKMFVKCNICKTRAKFEYWHYEGYNPTKEEREQTGIKRQIKHTDYTFQILK